MTTTTVEKREAERGTHSPWAEQACQDLTGVSASQPPTEHAAEPCSSRSGWHPTSPHLLAACRKLSAPLPRPSTSMSAFSQDSDVISKQIKGGAAQSQRTLKKHRPDLRSWPCHSPGVQAGACNTVSEPH